MKIIIDTAAALVSLQDKIDGMIRKGASYIPAPPAKLFSHRVLRLWQLADSLASDAYSAAVDRMARRHPEEAGDFDPPNRIRQVIDEMMYGPHTLMDNRPNGATPDVIVRVRLSVVRS